MKNPVEISKKAYSEILRISEIEERLDGLEKTAADSHRELLNWVKAVHEQNDIIMSDIADFRAYIDDSISQLSNEIARLEKVQDMYFWSLYQKDKKRFFKELSPATGKLRLVQERNAELLKQFADFCNRHELTYWLTSGTLLGAVRHGGSIPWDDDIDVAMPREDVEKLIQLVGENSEYRVTVVYDYIVKSRQIRFRSKNPSNPCFVDIFIHDYVDLKPERTNWVKQYKEKEDIIDQIENDNSELVKQWRTETYIDETPTLKKFFYTFHKKPSLAKSKTPSIIWSLDNLFDNNGKKHNLIFSHNTIFPLKDIKFEGANYKAPHLPEKYLEQIYGDIYTLPKDLTSHFQHIDYESLEEDKF